MHISWDVLRRGVLCQKQLWRAGTSNYMPQYLSLPLIPASGTTLLTMMWLILDSIMACCPFISILLSSPMLITNVSPYGLNLANTLLENVPNMYQPMQTQECRSVMFLSLSQTLLTNMLQNATNMLCAAVFSVVNFKTDSRHSPSQWKMSLQSNIVSHWLWANLESTLILVISTDLALPQVLVQAVQCQKAGRRPTSTQCTSYTWHYHILQTSST